MPPHPRWPCHLLSPQLWVPWCKAASALRAQQGAGTQWYMLNGPTKERPVERSFKEADFNSAKGECSAFPSGEFPIMQGIQAESG